ncbi:helix-turn-helix domain-containing protein [Amycolatopsis thermalba]|uniref:Helix-turn-helix domain-containing protein n=1 Tax=Amycolatopsis thermalba TaxID=944492 RepID=A0ABY4NX43_9PSEU|nr:helix-turn-helix domain-containing protein [Amycolatopsis thermalba]UQS24630.1 helix-turn-helix domain-containing protein [Amycolatopsis thermalba]
MSTDISGIDALVDALLGELDDLADAVTRRIRHEVVLYQAGDPVPTSSLRQSVRDNAELILRQFVSDHAPDLSAPWATGRERAQQGAPLPEVVRAYRVGFAHLWDALVAKARASSSVDDRVLVDFAATVWRLVGTYTDAMADAYRDTASQIMLEREHERSMLVEALFTGVLAQDTLWEAAQTLGLPVEGCFVVVAAEIPELGKRSLVGIESRLRSDGIRSAWRLSPEEHIGVLALPYPSLGERLPDLLRGRATARIGLSPAYPHLRETPRALRLARLALGTLPPGRAGVAPWDDAPVAVLIAAAPGEAERVASAVFGPLLDLPPADRKVLVDTLDAWFACAGSAAEAGKRLYCHPNTVRYRLRRVEELTGRGLGDPRAVAELATALQVVRLLPARE